MKTLVIAQSLTTFLDYLYMAFPNFDGKVNKICGRAVTQNGDEYIFVSSVKGLRGYHGVEVEFWGPMPQWALECDHLEALTEFARLK